jgi:hypothetical protein
VYAGPYWDEQEVTRVLRGLRHPCGLAPLLLRYYADFTTHLRGVGRLALYESRLRGTFVKALLPPPWSTVGAAPMPGERNEAFARRHKPSKDMLLTLVDQSKYVKRQLSYRGD